MQVHVQQARDVLGGDIESGEVEVAGVRHAADGGFSGLRRVHRSARRPTSGSGCSRRSRATGSGRGVLLEPVDVVDLGELRAGGLADASQWAK